MLGRHHGKLPSIRVYLYPQVEDCHNSLNKSQRRLLGLVVAIGYLEPLLTPGWIRLRWRCRCGAYFKGDVVEYREGGVNQVVERMDKSTGAEVTITSYTNSSAKRNGSFRIPEERPLTGRFLGRQNHRLILPQRNAPIRNSIPTNSTATNATPPTAETLHLLACVQQTQERNSLLQESVAEVKNGPLLFLFLKQQLSWNAPPSSQLSLHR
ncbi:hypothetical protein M3J09_003295 [Ascochyta lentis]